jgi:pimeloyl-[acyl-carrier protein] methyl ester esterase
MSALHAEISGRGRDLVLLHGWGANLRVFDELTAALARRFRVIALDLPGHGRSSWDPHATTPAAQAWRVCETLAPLTNRYSLLGWSLGGQFALDLAAALPGGIERLVLVATTPKFLAAPGWRHGLKAAALEALAARLHADPPRALDEFLRLTVLGERPRTAARVLKKLLAALAAHGTPRAEALACDLERLRDGDLRAQLAAVRAPTLVIAGGRDRIARAAAARALAAALPRGRCRTLTRAAHVPFLSHPQQFATLVSRFLRRR